MKKIFTIAIFALSINAFAQNSNKTQIATKNLTIIGTIKNFDKFVSVVAPGISYFQLVPISADGSFKVTTDDKGRVTYTSDLPKLSVPKKATFSFNIPNVAPGKYFIAAQKLNSGMGKTHCLITNKGEIFIINLSADSQTPHTINAGEMSVQIK